MRLDETDRKDVEELGYKIGDMFGKIYIFQDMCRFCRNPCRILEIEVDGVASRIGTGRILSAEYGVCWPFARKVIDIVGESNKYAVEYINRTKLKNKRRLSY